MLHCMLFKFWLVWIQLPTDGNSQAARKLINVATDIVVSTVALELHNSDMPMYLSISKMAFRAKIHFGI